MAQEIKGAALPARCAELGVRDEHGVPMVNSRALGERFEKNHQHVLRDIDNLIGGMSRSGQTRPWFHEIITINEQNGQSYRSFDLTRPGFALLVNRWTGDKPLRFQVAYNDAFDLMERALEARGHELIRGLDPNVFGGVVKAITGAAERRIEQFVEKLLTDQIPAEGGR